VFTDDTTKLDRQLGAEVSKTSALEIHPVPPMVREIGMSL
jgi:hypothetical protein